MGKNVAPAKWLSKPLQKHNTHSSYQVMSEILFSDDATLALDSTLLPPPGRERFAP